MRETSRCSKVKMCVDNVHVGYGTTSSSSQKAKGRPFEKETSAGTKCDSASALALHEPGIYLMVEL